MSNTYSINHLCASGLTAGCLRHWVSAARCTGETLPPGGSRSAPWPGPGTFLWGSVDTLSCSRCWSWHRTMRYAPHKDGERSARGSVCTSQSASPCLDSTGAAGWCPVGTIKEELGFEISLQHMRHILAKTQCSFSGSMEGISDNHIGSSPCGFRGFCSRQSHTSPGSCHDLGPWSGSRDSPLSCWAQARGASRGAGAPLGRLMSDCTPWWLLCDPPSPGQMETECDLIQQIYLNADAPKITNKFN